MRSYTLSIIAILSGLAVAQEGSNDTDTIICRNQQALDQVSTGTVNSTGSVSFTWNTSTRNNQVGKEPWLVNVLVNHTLRGREGNTTENNGGTIAWSYLSVPKDIRNVSACVFQFAPRNATVTGTGSEVGIGCTGVLLPGCTSYLREALLNSTSGSYNSELRCSSLLAENSVQKDTACGSLGGYSFMTFQDVSTDTCTYSSLPGVNIPDNYVTSRIGSSLFPFDITKGSRWDDYSDMAYNLHVYQPVPYAIVATFASGVEGEPSLDFARDAQFLCVTPNNTQPGSRVPENPWKSDTSAGVSWQANGVWYTLIASTLAFVFSI